jgi:hypothetical protein
VKVTLKKRITIQAPTTSPIKKRKITNGLRVIEGSRNVIIVFARIALSRPDIKIINTIFL